MGGKIGVISQLGEGSTFWFEVTFNKSNVQHAPLADHSQLTNKRILVVDDMIEARESLHGMLIRFNFYTEIADSGINALKIIEQADKEGIPFHVVLLDWKMPDMDGIETAKNLLALPLKTKPKIIFVTAYADLFEKYEVTQFSRIQLTKPVTPSALQDALVSVLNVETSTFAQAQAHEQDTQADAIKFNDVHLLLAEDNPINQDVAMGLLKKVGIKVSLAENGQIALDMAKENQYDFILMDLQMPVLDGLQATLAIRALPQMQEIPILAMTANAFSEDKEQCLKAGMNDHIAKPVSPRKLYQTLANYLPKEKIIYVNNKLTNPLPYLKPSVIEQMQATEGFDHQRGVRNAGGDNAFYLSLLKKFFKQYNQELASALSKPSADSEDIHHLAHALKGSAFTLGLTKLGKLAKVLEQEAKNSQQISALILSVSQISHELNQLEQALNPILEEKEVFYAALKIDKQEIHSIIKELESLLKIDDTEAIEFFNHRKELFKQAFGTSAETLGDQIDGFDFSGALKTLRVLDLSTLEKANNDKQGL